MDFETIRHAARLARISALIAVQDLALRHTARGSHLDEFVVELKAIVEKELDTESEHMLRAWSVRPVLRRTSLEPLRDFVRPTAPSP